jgi:hypothetical protein
VNFSAEYLEICCFFIDFGVYFDKRVKKSAIHAVAGGGDISRIKSINTNDFYVCTEGPA